MTKNERCVLEIMSSRTWWKLIGVFVSMWLCLPITRERWDLPSILGYLWEWKINQQSKYKQTVPITQHEVTRYNVNVIGSSAILCRLWSFSPIPSASLPGSPKLKPDCFLQNFFFSNGLGQNSSFIPHPYPLSCPALCHSWSLPSPVPTLERGIIQSTRHWGLPHFGDHCLKEG